MRVSEDTLYFCPYFLFLWFFTRVYNLYEGISGIFRVNK
nr:MAG TPA: hypothetical protein [Caudoviricetes sp.]